MGWPNFVFDLQNSTQLGIFKNCVVVFRVPTSGLILQKVTKVYRKVDRRSETIDVLHISAQFANRLHCCLFHLGKHTETH